VSQSTIIALLLALGFLVYIAARGRLPLYMAALGIGSGNASQAASGAAGGGVLGQITGVANQITGAANSISGAAKSIGAIGDSLKSLGSYTSGGGDYGGGGGALGVPDALGDAG
jgi:hypothetical protein